MGKHITANQVAKKLGISVKTLRNRMSSGNSPAYYKPGRIALLCFALLREDEVDDWIESHRVEPVKTGGGNHD